MKINPLATLLTVFHPLGLKRYLLQAFSIFRTEGFFALAHRIRLKLNSFDHSLHTVQTQYELEQRFHPLAFAYCPSPSVSIIIPTYNQSKYLFTCLKSILAHTDGIDYEIIVVDDCSGTELKEMLKQVKNISIVENQPNTGFIESINKGADRARGTYLLFLNNDTIVTPNWLSALLDTYATDPQTGLVGSMLIYPDGRLQEAGGIIWQDGSGLNYGKFDHPDRPEYNYRREVDYCSGACLMIKRELFVKLGKFSTAYLPAYYEDTDLAFKVKQAGLKVIYQPCSRVIHFEGVSSGTTVYGGVKKYQEKNRKKFIRQWSQVLSTHRLNGIQTELEKERQVNQRILIIDLRVATPDKDSGSYRMMHIIKIFQEIGYKVTFAGINLNYVKPYTQNLQRMGVEVLYKPFTKSLKAYLKQTGAIFDIVFISRADAADRCMDHVKAYATEALVIFDTVDLHFVREHRMAKLKKSASLTLLAKERKKQELRIAQKADIVTVVSPQEEKRLRELLPKKRVCLLSNIHEVKEETPGFENRHGLLFIGSFEHPPNVDAVAYFLDEVWVKIVDRLTNIACYIVGNAPPQSIVDRSCANIVVTGYVPDLAVYLNQCRVSIAPLRFGSGVKGKINMSMSYGLPVVATPVAIEGMYVQHGHDILVANGSDAFVEAVCRLYTDVNLWDQLARNSKHNVDKYFSPSVARERIEEILEHA